MKLVSMAPVRYAHGRVQLCPILVSRKLDGTCASLSLHEERRVEQKVQVTDVQVQRKVRICRSQQISKKEKKERRKQVSN